MDERRAPGGSARPLYLSLCSRLLSPFIASIHPSSLPPSPSSPLYTLLSSSLLRYLPLSLHPSRPPPSASFHVATHYRAARLSLRSSLPPFIPPSLPSLGVGLQPPVSWPGRGGEEGGGGVPDGQTLNSRGEKTGTGAVERRRGGDKSREEEKRRKVRRGEEKGGKEKRGEKRQGVEDEDGAKSVMSGGKQAGETERDSAEFARNDRHKKRKKKSRRHSTASALTKRRTTVSRSTSF